MNARILSTLIAFVALLLPLPTSASASEFCRQDADKSTDGKGTQLTLDLDAELAGIPSQLRKALLAGRTDEVLAALTGLRSSQSDQADLWDMLEIVALAECDRLDDAITRAQAFEVTHADSVWIHKVRYRRADLLVRQGRHQEAEHIWEQAAQELRSAERQGALAAIYLEYADKFSIPADATRPDVAPEYHRALELYGKVLELDAPARDDERARFRIAHCHEMLGNWHGAVQAWDAYLALDTADQKNDARLRKGKAQLAMGWHAQARRTFEDLLQDVLPTTQDSVREIAGQCAYEIARTWHIVGGDHARMAITAYERYLEAYPDLESAPDALFSIATIRQSLWELEAAREAFAAFYARPALNGATPETLERDARLRQEALYFEALVLGLQENHSAASERFHRYTQEHPTGPRWAEAQQGIVTSAWLVGAAARDEGQWDAAQAAWESFLEKWPLDDRVRQVGLDLATLDVERAREAREADQDATPHLRRALERWRAIAERYAGTEEASQALFHAALTLETELNELGAAVETYRACTFGGHAGAARQRLDQMLQPSLAILTERTWRSGEDAQIDLQIRNHGEVEVSIYRLDLEAYFRKHLTHRRVEDLDLDLIAADHTFKVTIDDFAEFAPLERSITLPVEGPGVWAIAVTAGEQRATTLVVRSDVDVIVKSSRREVFVFAEDMPSGQPAQGVRVLIALPGQGAGGGPALEEVTTGRDGVGRLTFSKLADADQLRVFAVRDGHVASEGLSLSGLVRSSGLTPRGLVFTDRPAFRPGETVYWRAVLRDVKDGQYSFQPDDVIRVEILDSHGRLVRNVNAGLSAFGTIDGEFALSEMAALGDYQIRCSNARGYQYTGSFQVQEYQMQKVELTLETERSVYYRGEKVTVEAKAAWYYGEPIAHADLNYNLPDGRQLTTKTDAEGKATFTFDTRDFPSEGGLGFGAHLPVEGASAGGSIYLALRGFRIGLTAPTRVVLAGESFPLDIHTKSPSGEDVEQELTLRITRSVTERGRVRQVEVETRRTRTGFGGLAQESLSLPRGGTYTLQVEGLDRFGNPITASRELFVSGDDDEVRLRVIADQSRVEVGGDVTLQVINRAGSGLALITFEGETILGHRIVQLDEGQQEIAFQVDPSYFPNMAVSVNLMHAEGFFDARANLTVTRGLRVTINPSAEIFEPGQEAQVEVVVTDALGNPVEAEISLAVVDDALFRSWPEALPALATFFETGAHRQAELRTVSTCAFRYVGTTRRISQGVLDEEQRRESLAAWSEDRAKAIDQLASLGYSIDTGAIDRSLDVQGLELSRIANDPATSAGVQFERHGVFALGGIDPRQQDADTLLMDAPGAGGGAGGRFQGIAGQRPNGRGRQGGPGNTATRNAQTIPVIEGDTLLWLPSVVTDASGKGKVTFKLPSRATRWRMTARGVGSDTLLGEARTTFQSRAELFVEIQAPAQLTEGDIVAPVLRLHDLTGKQGTAKITLSAVSATGTKTRTYEVELQGPLTEISVEDLDAVPSHGSLVLEASATVRHGDEETLVSATEDLRIRPWGVMFADGAGGELSEPTTVWLELPVGRTFTGREVELFLGPGVNTMLMDEALGRGNRFRSHALGDHGSHAATAGDLIGVAAVLRSASSTNAASPADLEALRERAQSLVATLNATQNGDGGWGFRGKSRTQPMVTARCVWGLAEAQARGIRIDDGVLQKAKDRLRADFQNATQSQDELKAVLQHALSTVGSGDFAALNRLHRERHTLSPAALAHTSLALHLQGRTPMAREIAEVLESRAEVVPDPRGPRCCWKTLDNDPWNRSQIEQTAMIVHALSASLPASPKVAEGIAWLHDGRPWGLARAHGLVVMTLSDHEALHAPNQGNASVTVRIADGAPQNLELKAGDRGHVLNVSLDGNSSSKIKVELTLRGQGRPHFAAVLRGITDDLDEERDNRARPMDVDERTYYAVAPLYRGRELSTGFGSVTGFDEGWSNQVTHLPVGHKTRVRLRWWRASRKLTDGHLVLEIPIPAGTDLMSDTFSGGMGDYTLQNGALIVPIDPQNTSGYVSFELIGRVPGTYRVLPAILRSVHEPSFMSLSDASTITVLPRGATSPDEYRPTPDELLHLGKAQYDHGEHDAAHATLTALYKDFEPFLRETQLVETAHRLLMLSIDRKKSDRIVEYFEVLKEKDPSITIPFERIVAIGGAYRDLNEFERALLIFRATVLETFGKDLKVAGTLESLGERAGSVRTLQELWLTYPDAPVVVETHLTLSDKLLAFAPEAARDASMVRQGWGRGSLTKAGIRHLDRFLALYPSDPMAADAALALVSARLDLDDFEGAAELAGEMGARFTSPRYADAFLYSQAVAQWYLGNVDAATTSLKRIIAAEYADEVGRLHSSINKDLATYILAQIHHASRDLVTAADYYERIQNLFSDAREALAGFRHKQIGLEEVTSVRPGETVELEISHKNVSEADLLVYRVDLMTLYLRERDLSDVTQVNLSGISPTLRTLVSLADASDLRVQTTSTTLALTEPGAYLVICRADELFASGLVLLSDLELEVQEDPHAGRLRIQALNREDGTYLRDVDVRVVGSGAQGFNKGETDPRGLFVADGVQGRATVIARLDDRHYAFFRGVDLLAQAQQQRGRTILGGEVMDKDGYFKNTLEFNKVQVGGRAGNYKSNLDKSRDGVQIQQVK
tara:strand:+ start:33967 stop:41973 length:8007 start_codon:yes stop_codon:yes gene_type:complete